MRKCPKVKKEEVAEVRALAGEYKLREIADLLNMPYNRVRYISQTFQMKNPPVSIVDSKEAVRLRDLGYKYKQIAEIMGKKRWQVDYLIRLNK